MSLTERETGQNPHGAFTTLYCHLANADAPCTRPLPTHAPSQQIQGIINWGHRMLELVRLAEQAKLPPQQPQQGQGQGQGQQAAATVAAPRPLDGPRSQAQTAAGQAGRCAACGAAPPADGPPLKACSQCRTVAYCSRACQVGRRLSLWILNLTSRNVLADRCGGRKVPSF